MQFVEGVDIPEEVITAHAEGKLVLFVGAGASKSAPSSLPLFDELAQKLGARARSPFGEAYRNRIDTYIGSLPKGFDTHRHAAELLQPEGSTPNDVHRAVVRLAACGTTARIVTTNFDNHLWCAAEELGVDLGDQWIGPALPIGRDFCGVVHLHGSLTRHHDELILDDRDFGRAYFGDGWAPRFLQPMFSEHVVLFIGYSLTDTVMRYLTLGLPSNTPRYALVPEVALENSDLARLQVSTIPYPSQDGDHSVLPRVLDAWARWKGMGQDDHQERIASLIAPWETENELELNGHAPELSVVDDDYLRAQISTVDGAKIFASMARSVRWLEWADRLPEFQEVFSSTRDLSEASIVLADWFVRLYVAVPSLSGSAMQSLRRHGQKLHPALIRDLNFALHKLEEDDLVAAQKWRVVLATSIHGHSAPIPLEPLLSFEVRDSVPHSAVVRRALMPFLNLKSNFGLWGGAANDWPRAEPEWPIDEHYMKEYIQAWLAAQQANTGVGLVTLESALLTAYEMLDAYNGHTTRGVLEWGRSAIEPHSQDRHAKPIDIIIDGLRDLGLQTRDVAPPLHERWWAYEFGLFRRLALHQIAESSKMTPDEKIEWLLDRQLLYVLMTKHETFRVLQIAVPEATPGTRSALLRAVLDGDPDNRHASDEERTRTYEIYNLLVWLSRADPDWGEVAVELSRLRVNNPDFGERPHPDFSVWHETGSWTSMPEVPIEEFQTQVRTDPMSALASLGGLNEDDTRHEDDFFRQDYALVRGLATESPWEGIALWDAADSSETTDDRRIGIRNALASGWAKAVLGDAESEVLSRVAKLASDEDNLYTVTEFLLKQSRSLAEGPDSAFLENSRRLALSIWTDHRNSYRPYAELDPSSLALNTWPGNLVYFWIAQIGRRWREAESEWSGLNAQEDAALTNLLNGPPPALEAIRPAVGSELYFFDAADPEFTDKHLLPLFAAEESGRQVWEPFLYHPRVNDRLLRAGLLDAVVSVFYRLTSLATDRLEGQFESLAASIVNFAALEDHERQCVLDAAIISENGIHAADFAEAVVSQLHKDSRQSQEAWESWLHRHLLQRFAGIPREPTKDELARWADLVPSLGDHTAEAAMLFMGRGIGFGKTRFNQDFQNKAWEENGPELVLFYAERIRNSTPSDFLVPYRVRKLVESLQSALGDDVAQPLINAATDQGFFDGRTI